MTDHEKLVKICYRNLDGMAKQDEIGPAQFGEAGEVYEDQLPTSYEECKNRLDLELDEIKKKEEAWMFLRFYRAVKHKKIESIEKNEHNLFTWYVLGVCPNVNINKGPAYTEAELPDIDVDYHPVVREYLKDDFSFRQYGKQHVCNIGSYQTYDVRSSLIDMARVMDYDRDEINFITKRMGMKDDDSNDVTFKGLEETFEKIEQKQKEKKQLTKYEQIAKELAEYAKEHDRVWEAASQLVSSPIDWKKFGYGKPPRRKKSMGQHASGLIIAGVDLPKFVPLVVPPGSRDQGLQATAWVEGLADTDCSSVGLVKFDYLSLEANAKVAECNRLIMQRYGLDSICALPGLSNWSDTSYLNDLKAIEMANAGDLKGIFQFDSNGIRKLAKKGGVTSFEDLVAYSALYRPGPMDEGMHDEYCDRKNGKKEYEIHPLLVSFLGRTFGVLVYQEQVMRALNVVGDIPLSACEAARKAISKKKKDKIDKLKEQFIDIGRKKLNVSVEWLEEFFAQIVAFAGYGFNLSHAVAYTYISARQLWQKAHYPLEFYTAALRSLKTADDRISVYIQDARKRGIPVNRLDLNKSRFDFEIADDNEIYYGFNKIKGVGHDVATRIVQLQPYRGFQDFLERFGTEAKVVQPLISLQVFKEKDPHALYLYYEAYKKAVKAEKDRCQRNKNSVQRYMKDLAALVGPDRVWEHGFDDNYFGKLRSWLEDDAWIKLCTLKKKYDKCVETFAEKSKGKEDISMILSLDKFVPPSPSNKTLTLGKSAFKTYKTLKPILKDPEGLEAEVAFYGFPWKNDFEQCPNYKGFTFDDYEIDILRAHPGTALPVEVKIMSKEHVTSRSGKMQYWKIRVCDALEPDVLRSVTVWEHDYDRFEATLQPGNIVRMRLYPPEHPYPNYSLESVKPWEMRGKNPYGEDPKWDLRVVLLTKGIKKKKFIDDEDDSYLLSPGRKKKLMESMSDEFRESIDDGDNDDE